MTLSDFFINYSTEQHCRDFLKINGKKKELLVRNVKALLSYGLLNKIVGNAESVSIEQDLNIIL